MMSSVKGDTDNTDTLPKKGCNKKRLSQINFAGPFEFAMHKFQLHCTCNLMQLSKEEIVFKSFQNTYFSL